MHMRGIMYCNEVAGLQHMQRLRSVEGKGRRWSRAGIKHS